MVRSLHGLDAVGDGGLRRRTARNATIKDARHACEKYVKTNVAIYLWGICLSDIVFITIFLKPCKMLRASRFLEII